MPRERDTECADSVLKSGWTHIRRAQRLNHDRNTRAAVLTDAGESVLAGHANAVELNGIDDWVLGVHLDSENGSVWYRKDGALVPR